MNKIQLEATLQLAEIDCENNPTPVNQNRLAQAKLAFDTFMKAQEVPAVEPQKQAKPSAPKKPSTPTPKKETPPAPKKEKVEQVVPVIPDATANTAVTSAEEQETDVDPDAQVDGEETETDPNANVDGEETDSTAAHTAETTDAQADNEAGATVGTDTDPEKKTNE